jgi:MoaA/NifB/PqqE/SkfB family radical SAM enzyme
MRSVKETIFKEMVNQVISNKILRSLAVKKLNKYLYNSIMNLKNEQLPEEREDQYAFSSSIVNQAKNNLDRGFLKPEVVKKMVKVFVGDSYSPDRSHKMNSGKENYKNTYGEYPPQFLVLSPGKGCNLRCTGCYAAVESLNGDFLNFEILHRIIKEAHDLLGNRFMTISGGEPLLYKSEGKTLLDIFREFSDIFFLMYTNGTLLTPELAQRLTELGNVTPAISLEGWQEQTDKRRGKGVYGRILQGMDNLRNAGVPFGISVTATKDNVDTLLQDDFYEYFFNEIGISYMWQFQMMPIGKGKDSLQMLITPKQRLKLFYQWNHLLRDKHFPVADFWNSGSLSGGCLAYGRWTGYFYIDWNGNIMPCVFVPYYVDNIEDLYRNGKTLPDALHSRLFKNGRKWQKEYGFTNLERRENILMPCSFRDHYVNFKKNILTPDVKAENKEAEELLKDPEFESVMNNFDHQLKNLTEPVFQEKYLKKTVNDTGDFKSDFYSIP